MRRSPFPPPFIERALKRPKGRGGASEPRFRSVRCVGDCIVSISATVLGRRIDVAGSGGGVGLPRGLALPGSLLTALWEEVLKEWREGPGGGDDAEGMTADEFSDAFGQLMVRLLLDRHSLVQVLNAPRRRARANDKYY